MELFNPVAEKLTGWTEAEAHGRPLNEVFRIVNQKTREKIEDPVTKVLRDGMVVGLSNNTVLIARDGVERPIADSGAPIRDDNARVEQCPGGASVRTPGSPRSGAEGGTTGSSMFAVSWEMARSLGYICRAMWVKPRR